ncbi:hypothetical protein DICVIV_07589 [Dictyocaulus viviparus]|uniref:DH domain-containing protein n=1 Tax=Dictyocaulus viviparus TaxID=29172 RepID=A0A0D8XRH2_DICVI|nr:hypothetical protein DICVIV_07589 [Dictyocaulus viviparus]
MSKECRKYKTIVSIGSSVVKKKDWAVELLELGIRLKPFSSRTKYLVASSVQDIHYRRAIALGIYVVNEEFLQQCLELETLEDITNVAELCRLQRFSGITVGFIGMSGQIVEDFGNIIKDNGGRVCTSALDATHLIVAPGERPSASCYGKNLVTIEWFRESMDLGWCANEQCFEYKCVESSPLRPSSSFLKFQRRRRDQSSAMKYKRYQLCLELFKTEINCLKAADFLVRLFKENVYVPAEANDIMFGVFSGMRKVHDKIVQNMGRVLDAWNDRSTIGDIFVGNLSLLTDAYSPYFHTLEASLQYIKEYRKQNPKFNSFIIEKESDRSLGKQKLEYLLNIPFQQITSRIPTSLKEIRSQTTIVHPDFESLGEAVTVIDSMLATINENKRMCAESEAIFKKIRDLPSHLLKAPRQFVCGMEFLTMPSRANAWICSLVELLLFKDCILALLYRLKISNLAEERMLVIVVRNPTKDAEWYLRVVHPSDLINEFLAKLIDEVFFATGRRISVDVGCSSELDDTTLNDSDALSRSQFPYI